MSEANHANSRPWLPEVGAGKLESRFFPEEGSCVTLYSGCTEKDFDACLQALEQDGFGGGDDYTLSENRYALRHGKDATVYLSYSAPTGKVRLYAAQKGLSDDPDTREETAAASVCEPMFWQLPADVKGSRLNGGMTLVLRTPAGTFAVIDGGYDTEDEADRIYRCLKENTPEGHKTVIEGWWFTHLHWDHFGGFIVFSQKYAAEIPVKAFYLHTDRRGIDAGSADRFMNAMDAWTSAAKYTKLHTGMKIMQGGACFRVLYTLEDMYPMTAAKDYDFNSTSTVFSIDVGGQRWMILGDVMMKACNLMMEEIPRDLWKSDVVQYSHHGYEGGTRELYDAIAAPTVLWPMNVTGYQEGYPTVPQNVFGMWHSVTKCGKNYPLQNNYICKEAAYVKKILLPSEEGLPIPYTPTGERMPDYEAIFLQETAEEQ